MGKIKLTAIVPTGNEEINIYDDSTDYDKKKLNYSEENAATQNQHVQYDLVNDLNNLSIKSINENENSSKVVIPQPPPTPK